MIPAAIPEKNIRTSPYVKRGTAYRLPQVVLQRTTVQTFIMHPLDKLEWEAHGDVDKHLELVRDHFLARANRRLDAKIRKLTLEEANGFLLDPDAPRGAVYVIPDEVVDRLEYNEFMNTWSGSE